MRSISLFIFFNLALLCSVSFAQNCGDLPSYSFETVQSMYSSVADQSFGLKYKGEDANDHCDERAQRIHSFLKQNGIKSLQAYIQTENEGGCGATGASCIGTNGPFLIVTSIYDQTVEYSWEFHTAPVVCVKKENQAPELYVIDPSTALKVEPFKSWVKVITYGLESSEYSTFFRPFRVSF